MARVPSSPSLRFFSRFLPPLAIDSVNLSFPCVCLLILVRPKWFSFSQEPEVLAVRKRTSSTPFPQTSRSTCPQLFAWETPYV